MYVSSCAKTCVKCAYDAAIQAPHDDELSPTATPGIVAITDDQRCTRPHQNYTGFKLGAAKSMDEYAQLDAEDESLARWKASLGIVPGAAAVPADGPKVSPVREPGFYRNLSVTGTR